MKKAYYTLQEAREILPDIKPILKELVKCQLKLVVRNNVSLVYEDPFENTKHFVSSAVESNKIQFNYLKLLETLFEKGIFVKDPDTGLIDFFSMHEGREIFLCYKYPEETISHWHELEHGFADRQPISTLVNREKHY